MAIKPPAWIKNGVPTARGWTDGRTGELLKAMKISQADIDEFNGVVEEVAPVASPAMLTEAPTTEEEFVTEVMEDETVDFDDMTKLELEAIGRENGIELDRRESKASLVIKVKGLFS